MKMHNAKRYIIPALMLFIAFSCAFEEREIPKPPVLEDEFVDAVIHISFSSPSSPSTYALTPGGEDMIKEIDLLAFKKESGSDEYYAYRTRTTDFTVDQGTQQRKFTVSVKRSVNNEEYRFVIIANASAAVNNANFTTLATKEQVYARIISDLSGSDRWSAEETLGVPNMPIPMWGEAEPQVITEDLDLKPISMLRALSRIDVAVTDAQNKFRLTDIYVYNTNRKGRVVPEPILVDKINNPIKVTGASLPVDNNLKVKGPIGYTSSSETAYKNEIYLYEADAVKENEAFQATCLVIGGYYAAATTKKSYYRVDFFVDKKNNNLSFKPILRNHCYIINIVDVSNEGYENPDEAFDKRGINMTVEIKSWEMGYHDYQGNPYNFVINRNSFEHIGTDPFTGSFLLTTEDKGWTSSATQGVTLTPDKGEAPVTNQKVDFTVASGATEPIWIDIKSGPITKRITITR
jgi:hypothetical protein